MGLFSGVGVQPSLKGIPTNQITLPSGAVWTINPAGWYNIKPGRYTSIQQYDPIAGIWKTIGAGATAAPNEFFYSDGVNYRLANQTGAPVGALITNAGSGYTSVPTVTASAGGSVWRAIVGGAVNTTVTVTNGGVGYAYPPTVLFSAPPPGGIQASGICAISAGAVTSVTVTNQGAGYASPPTISFINDPREGLNGVSQGYNAAAVTTLTGAQTITGLLCVDHGTGGQTAVPTLAFAGGGGSSAAATAIMCWSITAYTVSSTTAGSGYAAPVVISAYGGFPGTAPAYVNTETQSLLLKTRAAQLIGALSGTALTATGQTVTDGGIYPGAPTLFAYGFIPGASAVQAVITPTMGGQTDTSYLTQV